MRKRQTFLLTIVTSEDETGSFRGRIKVISSGKSCTFTNLNELYELIQAEMGEEAVQRLSNLSKTCIEGKPVSS